MIAKADLPGYYQNPQRPLSDIVGRRDTFHLGKKYYRFPMLKDSTSQVPYLSVRTSLIQLASSPQAGFTGIHLEGTISFLLPEADHELQLSAHPMAKAGNFRIFTKAQSFSLADQMRQADLPTRRIEIGAIGTIAVRDDKPQEVLSQYLPEYLLSTAGSDMKEGEAGSNKYPKPAPLTGFFPTRLVYVQLIFFGQLLLKLRNRALKGISHFMDAIVHTAQAKINPKDSLQKPLNMTPREVVYGSKDSNQGRQTRPTTRFIFFLHFCPGALSTVRAPNCMVMMLGYNGLDRRYLNLLPISITASSRGIRGDIYSTATTHLRPMFYNLSRLKPLPSISLAPLLLAWFSSCWDLGRSLHRGRIAGRRLGGIGRVHSQTPSQFGNLFFKLEILLLQSLYSFQNPLIFFLFKKNSILLSHIVIRCDQVELYKYNDGLIIINSYYLCQLYLAYKTLEVHGW